MLASGETSVEAEKLKIAAGDGALRASAASLWKDMACCLAGLPLARRPLWNGAGRALVARMLALSSCQSIRGGSIDITTFRAPFSSAQSRDHAPAPYTFIRLRCCRGALAIKFACSPGGAGRDSVHYLVLARLARSVLSEPPLSPQCFYALSEAEAP